MLQIHIMLCYEVLAQFMYAITWYDSLLNTTGPHIWNEIPPHIKCILPKMLVRSGVLSCEKCHLSTTYVSK